MMVQAVVVAAIVTDTDLNELDPAGLHTVIHHSAGDVDRMRREAATVVDDMHTRTGLWDRLPESTMSLPQVDAALLEYIQRLRPGTARGA